MGILDGILGIGNKILEQISPEQNKIRLRNKIDKLEERQDDIETKVMFLDERDRKDRLNREYTSNKSKLVELYKKAKNN